MTLKENLLRSKYACILLLTLCISPLQAEDNVSTQGKQGVSSSSVGQQLTIQHLLTRIKALEKHVFIDKSLSANERDTYMPGWVMFSPEGQTQLWYHAWHPTTPSKRMLTPSGYEGNKDIYSLADCDDHPSSFARCLITFPVLDQFKKNEARGYVLNIATMPSGKGNAKSTSVACLSGNGSSKVNAHYQSNGFMNYVEPYTWKSDLIYCPVVKKQGKSVLYIRLASNKGPLDGKENTINTIGSVIGYW